jgi:hypothetical protein
MCGFERTLPPVNAGDIVDRVFARVPFIEKVVLGDGDGPGEILAWHNPTGVDIIVTQMALDLTVSTADPGFGTLADVGVAANATTSNDAIQQGVPLDNGGDPALLAVSTGFHPVRLPAGYYLTISANVGSADGLAGFGYISWFPAA